ncbi:MAG: DUF1294 domain-containing protein [Defluviitaleaceae bacterium]|nr:DUF1294 domain-containing protein [Defluviitaleaceae bacterium]
MKSFIVRLMIGFAAYFSVIRIDNRFQVTDLLKGLIPDLWNIVTFILFILFFIWNVVVFILYCIDKKRAANNKWRISESTLFLCMILMGALGSWDGIFLIRHKSQHWNFKIIVAVALYVQLCIMFMFLRMYQLSALV